jgi:hypothetical protein
MELLPLSPLDVGLEVSPAPPAPIVIVYTVELTVAILVSEALLAPDDSEL